MQIPYTILLCIILVSNPQLFRLDPNELQSRGVTPFIVTHLRALLAHWYIQCEWTMAAGLDWRARGAGKQWHMWLLHEQAVWIGELLEVMPGR